LFQSAITVEAVSDWELCDLQAIDNVDGNVDANIRYDITYLGRNNNDAFTNANTNLGFDHHEIGHNTTTMTYAAARLYFTPYDATLCNATRYIVKDGVAQVKACGPEHVGKYLISAHVTDSAGVYGHNAVDNTRTMEQAILIQDTKSPTIFLAGDSPSYVECRKNGGRPTDTGNSVEMFDYEAFSFTESDCRDRLDTIALGRYLPVTTTLGELSNVVRHTSNAIIVNTQDNQFPQWPTDVLFETKLYTDNKVNTINMLDQLKVLGNRTLKYTCLDYSSNEAAEVTRQVITHDTHSPTLILTDHGKNTILNATQHAEDTDIVIYNVTAARIEAHENVYNHVSIHSPLETEFGGAYSSDSCDASINNNSVTVSWGPRPFNGKVLGDYVRTYTVSDGSNNKAIKTRTYTVIDSSTPKIDMVSAPTDVYEADRDREYTDYGATCTDFIDGELSHAVEVSGEVVNMRIPGTYKIRYDCQDLTGNSAIPVFRQVEVQDTIKPIVTLKGPHTNYVESGFPYVDAGATATDTLDGDITQYIWTDGNTVATQNAFYNRKSCGGIAAARSAGAVATAGEYYITRQVGGAATRVLVHCYFAGDNKGTWLWRNAGDPACASYDMVSHAGAGPCAEAWFKNCPNVNHTAATASGTGAHFCTIPGDFDSSSGITDQDGSSGITLNGHTSNDAAVQGFYKINFNVEDKAGNSNDPVPTRTVVVKDTLPPVITLKLKDKLLHVSKRNHFGLGHDGDSVENTKYHQGDMKNPAGYYVGENAAGNPPIYAQFGNPHMSEHGDSKFSVDATGHDVYRAADHAYMAESTATNGWIIAAAASAVAGVALLGMSQRSSMVTSVPV
jgi:hypothetical protein